MKEDGHTSLGALIALKLVCCGGLLLVAGVISGGSLLALVNHPAAKIGALVAVTLGLWVVLRKRRTRSSASRAQRTNGHADDRNRSAT